MATRQEPLPLPIDFAELDKIQDENTLVRVNIEVIGTGEAEPMDLPLRYVRTIIKVGGGDLSLGLARAISYMDQTLEKCRIDPEWQRRKLDEIELELAAEQAAQSIKH